MNKRVSLFCFFVVQLLLFMYSQKSYSQQSDSAIYSRNTFYIGFESKGALYSVNYDRIFSKNKKRLWSYRIGVSVLENAIALPVGINLFTGNGNSHAEFGLSIIPYIDKYQYFLSSNDLSDKQIYLVPSIGYRFQKPNKGIFIKAFASPAIFLDPPSNNFWRMQPRVEFLLGCGFGYSF